MRVDDVAGSICEALVVERAGARSALLVTKGFAAGGPGRSFPHCLLLMHPRRAAREEDAASVYEYTGTHTRRANIEVEVDRGTRGERPWVTGVAIPRGAPVPTERIHWIRMGTTVATNALLGRVPYHTLR